MLQRNPTKSIKVKKSSVKHSHLHTNEYVMQSPTSQAKKSVRKTQESESKRIPPKRKSSKRFPFEPIPTIGLASDQSELDQVFLRHFSRSNKDLGRLKRASSSFVEYEKVTESIPTENKKNQFSAFSSFRAREQHRPEVEGQRKKYLKRISKKKFKNDSQQRETKLSLIISHSESNLKHLYNRCQVLLEDYASQIDYMEKENRQLKQENKNLKIKNSLNTLE